MSTKTAKVVAVVLNWNGWLDTIECVESLLRSERVPDKVVICDNGSLDGSVDRLKEWAQGDLVVDSVFVDANRRWSYRPVAKPLRFHTYSSSFAALNASPSDASLIVIENGMNLGYAGGNNIGIRYALERAGADFVWILNSDVVVDRHALQSSLDLAQRDNTIGIVGAKLLQYHAPETVQALGGGYIYPVICHDTQLGRGQSAHSMPSGPIKLEHLIGASLFVRAAAIEDVGLIDETYFLYREETDWCIRMRNNGWQLYCCAQAILWHKESRSIGFKSPVHDYYAVRNMLRLVQKFYPSALPSSFLYMAIRALVPKLFRLQFARMKAVLLALRDFLHGVHGRSGYHTDEVIAHEYVSRLPRS